MTAEIRSRRTGHTLVLTLSDPATRNALGPGLYAAAVEALNVAGDDRAVRCVVLTGDGPVFSSGGDLRAIEANRHQPPQVQIDRVEALHTWIETLASFPKPVIAAVEGIAAGAGCALVLACDLVVAARNARLSLPQPRLGLSPDGGVTWRLTRSVPRPLAMELLLGQPVDAIRLHAAGLVNRLTEPGEALTQALALAGELTALAPNAVASIKSLVAQAGGQSLAQQLAAERDHLVRNLHHPNAGIGLAAFLADQAPNFPSA